jgi:hypothetical protein
MLGCRKDMLLLLVAVLVCALLYNRRMQLTAPHSHASASCMLISYAMRSPLKRTSM